MAGSHGGGHCEWLQVGPGEAVVATAARTWLHRLGPADPFARPMQGPGQLATTTRLLEGAIAVGQRRGVAQSPPGARRPPLTPVRWIWRLAAYYHLTTHTPRLLGQAAARFDAQGRPVLAAWARDRQREEAGHDRLALRDLAALGLPAEAVVSAWRPPAAAALVAHFTALAEAEAGPVGVLGYAHAVERLALTLGADHVAAVRGLFPGGQDSTRCLRVHSADGSDAHHVQDNLAVIAGLPAEDRAQVALAALEAAALCSTAATWQPDDTSLWDDLATLGVAQATLRELGKGNP